MFEFNSILGTQFTLLSLLAVLGCSLGMGIILGVVYLFVCRKSIASRGLAVTLVVLPIVVSVIILIVQDSWARAFSLAGAFAVVRFRATQGGPKELSLIFTALGAGLASGTGFVQVGFIFIVFVAVVLIVLELMNFGEPRKPRMKLKITIPESLNYVGVFDQIFEKYTSSFRLDKVKSSNFGTMFDLTYDIVFKNGVNTKEFIDDLRTTNGNLNIVLQNYVYDPKKTAE